MNDPLRVAQIMGYMNGGGVEQVVMNYYRHIDRTRVQFDFLICDGSTRVPSAEIRSLGGDIFMVPPYNHPLEFENSLYELFCRQKWNIVHSHINALSVFSLRAAKRAGVPTRIAHSHSTSGKGEYKKNLIKTLLRPMSNLYPTHKMACSTSAGNWLFGNKANFDVIPNAINLSEFEYSEDSRISIRSDLDIPDGSIVVGHVGRFMRQKNHKFLVDMFDELYKNNNNIYLVLVGDGELRSSIESYVGSLGISSNVRFLGQRSDVSRVYSAMDVFCLPSLYEGLGMVAIEAQYEGLYCILSTNVPVETDLTGTCKYLPIDSPKTWADCISKSMPCARLSVKKAQFKSYDIELAAKKMTKIYTSLGETHVK